MKLIPVILSGGSGTRLWPLSRTQYPKQYLPLIGDNTMLQETVLRLNGVKNLADPIVICNTEHRFLAAEQLHQIGISHPTILLEPVGRNTAPAISAVAIQTITNNNDAILLVLSADHIIQNIEVFHTAISLAKQQAQIDKLVTFGIVPTNANTEYGYIRKGTAVDQAYQVAEFTEKPNQKTADLFFKTNDYLWNSGMFMFKASVLIDEMTKHSPKIITAMQKSITNATYDLDFIHLGAEDFINSPNDSIDYALMEKTDNVVVIPLDASWNDIGSWQALYEISNKDSNGNVILGDVILSETTNSYINANHHMVATIGVNNLIIVDTPNATLVVSKDKSQVVKNIVEQLKSKQRHEPDYHRKVYRPWGWYDSIETGDCFQVKRLHIKSNAKLSLQLHNQRAEHWVVVKGIAMVTNGDDTFELTLGQSTYIPVGVKHSLANLTDNELEIIEVQSGVYLGEDDIKRFEDIYGRN